jgi:lysyl-tRNA synthetase class 1
MNNKLKALLDNIGIEYEFKSSFAEYKKGTFNRALSALIENYETVNEIILPTLSEETRQSWFPFLPMCEICKNVLTTRVMSVSKKDLEIHYQCDRQLGSFAGCGHEGSCSILNGSGKMTWKVDWALRWKTFGVDYELYGKDLIESYKISAQIMTKVFKARAPEHMFYEMFLDEDGSKISKSKGKGLAVEDWLKYGSEESLRYLMFDKPRKAKELSLRIIPRYMNEVNELAEHYYSNGEKKDSHCQAYKLLTFSIPPARMPFTFDYSLLCNLLGAVGVEDSTIVKNYIFKVSPQAREFPEEEIDALIHKVRQYYIDVIAPKYVEARMDEKGALLLRELCAYLETERSDEEIHNKVYEIARTNNFEPKELFSLVYRVLLKQERGPRLGQLINILGPQRVREIISTVINRLH